MFVASLGRRSPPLAAYEGHQPPSATTSGRPSPSPSAFNPFERIIEGITLEERRLRAALGDPRQDAVHPTPVDLLRFASNCLAAAQTIVESCSSSSGMNIEDGEAALPSSSLSSCGVTTAYTIACHVETLMRSSLTSRRRYSSEDWLNLCRGVAQDGTLSAEDMATIDGERLRILAQSLELIAQICFLRQEYDDSLTAFEDAMALRSHTARVSDTAGGVKKRKNDLQFADDDGNEISFATLLNWLAIHERASRADPLIARSRAHDVVSAISQQLTLMAAEATAAVCSGMNVRTKFMLRRTALGKMLVAARLRWNNACARCLQQQQQSVGGAESASASPLRAWYMHSISQEYSEIEKLVQQELDASDDLLQEDVLTSLRSWSIWVSRATRQDTMWFHHEDRWKYQLMKARQFLALHPVYVEEAPALEFVCESRPYSHATLLLLMCEPRSNQAPPTPTIRAAPAASEVMSPLPNSTQTSRPRPRPKVEAAGGVDAVAPSHLIVPSSSAIETYEEIDGIVTLPPAVATIRSSSSSNMDVNKQKPGEAETRSGRSSSPSPRMTVASADSALFYRPHQTDALLSFKQRAFDVCGNYLLASSRSRHSASLLGHGEQPPRRRLSREMSGEEEQSNAADEEVRTASTSSMPLNMSPPHPVAPLHATYEEDRALPGEAEWMQSNYQIHAQRTAAASTGQTSAGLVMRSDPAGAIADPEAAHKRVSSLPQRKSRAAQRPEFAAPPVLENPMRSVFF